MKSTMLCVLNEAEAQRDNDLDHNAAEPSPSSDTISQLATRLYSPLFLIQKVSMHLGARQLIFIANTVERS